MTDVLALLRVTALVMVSWLAWWLVFAGWGILLLRACGRRVRGARQWIGAFWIGWSLTLPFLTVWHFFRRIDGMTALAVIAIGLSGHLFVLVSRNRNRFAHRPLHPEPGKEVRSTLECGSLRPLFFRAPNWLRVAGLLLFLALAFLAADHCLMPLVNFDNGLYHLQAIRWIEQYAVVPGLGNLHGRLAFNQSYFLYAAMLDAGPWHGVAHYWVSGLFPLTLMAHLMLKLAERRRPYENATRRLFWLLLAVPVFNTINCVNLPGPSPDLPIFTLVLTLAIELLDLLMLSPAATRGLPSRALKIVILALGGLTLKFNFVAPGFLAAALALGIAWARLRRRRPRTAKRLALAAALFSLLFLIPWAARDLFLSGYVGYPFPWLTLPLPWRVPMAAVRQELVMIHGLACDPFEALHPWPIQGWKWLPRWASYMNTFQQFDLFLPLGLVALGMGLVLWQRRRAIPPAGSRAMWTFLALPIPALLFWFFTAPHPRFAGGMFWIFAAGANAFILARFEPRLRWRLAAAMMLLSALLATKPIPFQWPKAGRGFPPIPHVDGVPYVTASGLRLLVPSGTWQCWDLPFPSTAYPKRGLGLIEPGNLQRGFKIEGPVTEKTS